jgi:hypothetical protein
MAAVKAQDRQSVAVRHFDGAKSRFLRTVGPSGRGGHASAIGRLKIRLNFIWFAGYPPYVLFVERRKPSRRGASGRPGAQRRRTEGSAPNFARIVWLPIFFSKKKKKKKKKASQ